MAAARNSRLDGIKFLLIVLVVVGHCIEPTRYDSEISGGLYSIIYSFHMPLFVFLSGYFAKVCTFEEWSKKSLRLFESFLVIMLPQCLITRSLYVFLNPEHSGWYLMSLCWWYGILCFLKRIKIEGWGGVIISLFVSFIVFLLPLGSYGRLLSFNRTFQMLPFFVGGFYLKNLGIPIPFNFGRCVKIILLCITSIFFCFLFMFSNPTLNILEYYYIDAWSICNYSGLSIKAIIGYRFFLMIGAIVISLTLVESIVINKYVASFGQYTLVIYVIQGVLARFLPILAPSNFYLEMVIAILIIIVSLVIIDRVDYRYITNPVSTVVTTIKCNNNENAK